MKPRLLLATLDDDRLVTVRFHRRVAVDRLPLGRFTITTEAGQRTELISVQPIRPWRGKSARFLLAAAEPIDFRSHSWRLVVEGFGELPIRMGRLLQDPARFFEPQIPLGAIYLPTATTFRVFAPTARSVRLVIADSLAGDAGSTEYDLRALPAGLWETTIDGNMEGKYYAYKLGGVGFDPGREITDIYATCTQGRRNRSLIVNLRKTDPPGFREHVAPPAARPTDAIIYEMHVRDFTIASDSGVDRKGKYLGLTETGTHLPDELAVRTGLDHLIELGITHVQLMPVQDFDNPEADDDWYNWGYMPAHFNSPDGWYASSRDGPCRITELKQAIQAFHDRGIGVILDVVYNHTSSRATFEQLVPDYYYRMTCRGGFSNGSGCGNEFSSESPMGRRFLLDSLRYWLEEYRVDGFRFDIMALIDVETMKRIKAELERIRPGILIYGEPWVAGGTPLALRSNQRRIRGRGIAAFNDRFRDAIKGDVNGRVPGFVQTGDRAKGIMNGLEGAIHDWAIDPADTVNYFECHDNLTAWDKLLLSVPDESDDIRKRMIRLGALTLFCSQGIILMHAGQEFCRSKKGSANSYDQPDEVNRIDWPLKKTRADVFEYHRALIAIRKAHPVLRLRTRQQVEQRVRFIRQPDPQCIVGHLDGGGLTGESATRMLILLNGSSRMAAFALSEGDWLILADACRASVESLGQVSNHVTLPAHSGMLLAQ